MTSCTSICVILMLLVLFAISASSAPICNGLTGCNSKPSPVTSYPGQWPTSYCKVKNVIFNTGEQVLRINGDLSELDACHQTKDIWKFESADQHVNNIVCDQVFSHGHFFTPYYYHGSNYFHLHYDTLLPLFVALHQDSTKSLSGANIKDIALLPGVETTRGEGIDWKTDAFDNLGSYWMQLLTALSKPHRLLPLDRRLAAINKTVCFEEAYFGTPKIDFSNPELLKSYASFVKKALSVKVPKSNVEAKKPKIGLIHREGRRKILNEAELVKSVSPIAKVDIVDFSLMSVKEQIEKVQQYNVLIGMNGAGLVNGLYLPTTSVAVQLVPFKAQLNVAEFANLLKGRGSYLEWHNKYPKLDHRLPEDIFRNGADTVVDVSEFVQIVARAIQMYRDNLHR